MSKNVSPQMCNAGISINFQLELQWMKVWQSIDLGLNTYEIPQLLLIPLKYFNKYNYKFVLVMWKTNSWGTNTFAKQLIDISTSFGMFFYYCIIYCTFMSMFFMSIPVIWIKRHLLFPMSILRIVGPAFVFHILSTVKIIGKNDKVPWMFSSKNP